MLIRPGRQVILKVQDRGSAGRASVLDVGKGTFSLSLKNGITLKRGDVIELGIPQQGDALYLLKACVVESGIRGSCILKEVGEPFRWQRRHSQRIPASLKSEYILLPQRVQDWVFRQGLILDISRGGALISMEEELKLSSELFFIFEVYLRRGEPFPTGVRGQVVRMHCRAGVDGYCYGMKFNKPFALLTA